MTNWQPESLLKHAHMWTQSSRTRYSYTQFVARYGDDTALLAVLWRWKYGTGRLQCPKCNRTTKYYYKKNTTRYICGRCGNLITPFKDTIFYCSHVPISMWWYAIYLFVGTQHRLRATELERVLGVQYRTAHRMLGKIKTLVPLQKQE